MNRFIKRLQWSQAGGWISGLGGDITIVLVVLVATAFAERTVEGYLKEGFDAGSLKGPEDDDHKKPFNIICKEKGYPFETHKVLTEDRYWLTLFRIPGAKGETREEAIAQRKPAIFLQHGILDSADTWIMHYEDEAPAFVLANAGYDVWLGNTRGNKYSREHQTLNPDYSDEKEEFWDFSFQEMAQYDVPANIDYIREETGKWRIGVMAHSQGTTQMYIRMTQDNSWWKWRVAVFVSLAGVARLDHCGSSLLTTLAQHESLIENIKRLGVYEMFPADYLQSAAFSRICKGFPIVCKLAIQLVANENKELDEEKRLATFMGHYPSGCSLKSLHHFSQILNSKRFQNFDYGKEKNLEIYGDEIPPEYDFSNIYGNKIIQVYGTADLLATPEDSLWLKEQLGDNLIFSQEYDLGHMSFLLAANMTFFDDVMEVLQENTWW
ncbi:unnamed protein product [Moneuplotes crassus]|uniref:Lipase n=1 Tax=Euplotes crassus TaxID=5936 RepID=A0AAD1UJL1_EUPCR|nr:unnamed protein product [Moneuplotes crassus]